MSPAQCRMARAALGLGVRELAALADVSTNTITRFEKSDAPDAPTVSLIKDRTIKAMKDALTLAGVHFVDVGEAAPGPGVTLTQNRS
nr:helix-turn-helix domain-containing protein [Devosia faecipullorum]